MLSLFNMNKYHQELLEEIKKYARKGTAETANYLGNNHIHYCVSVPQRRKIAKAWGKENKDISLEEFIDLTNSLFSGHSYEEKTMASILLGDFPKLRKEINPELISEWLDNLQGWAEIDTLCQSNFTPDEFLGKWTNWEKLIRKFAEDKNISKRRASLVLLTGVVAKSDDKRLADLALDVIDRLKNEKDILITKAISWLLRDLIHNSRVRVETYIKRNADLLPKIALREVANKLAKGKKN